MPPETAGTSILASFFLSKKTTEDRRQHQRIHKNRSYHVSLENFSLGLCPRVRFSPDEARDRSADRRRTCNSISLEPNGYRGRPAFLRGSGAAWRSPLQCGIQ